jgi:hypothetical protein
MIFVGFFAGPWAEEILENALPVVVVVAEAQALRPYWGYYFSCKSP